ncbi:MAG: vWA domain-containing protein [Kiritimatiellia bacterium]|jgi:Ca-activated chloride channel family protein
MNGKHAFICLFTGIAAMFLASCAIFVSPQERLASDASPALSAAPAAALHGGGVRRRLALHESARGEAFNTEEYRHYDENRLKLVKDAPLSTFGADVDTAGYTNTRRMLVDESRLPPKDAVRVEEFMNYFEYAYPQPPEGGKFAATFEMGECPWNAERQLLLVGIQGKSTDLADLPPSSFVFLIDNSGSMRDEMPLLRESMSMLAKQMRPKDNIGVVTYGGGAKVLIDSASGDDGEKIQAAIEGLAAGGFTPGAAGIKTAYELAARNFIKGGNNRVVLVTDGDFNVGVSSESELVSLIEKKRGTGVCLTVVGMGSGNYKDSKMKMLANKGNGNYIYIDSMQEARHALVNEMSGRMFTLARDVKFQVEFNPARVFAYRLVGYEFRKLEDRDFNDDTKDSGEVGVGHQVTVLYDLVMADAPEAVKKEAVGDVDALKYQPPATEPAVAASGDILTFKLRYQEPEGDAGSKLLEFVLPAQPEATENWGWASAVAEVALLLRDSPNKGDADYDAAIKRAKGNVGDDPDGRRAEFVNLATTARNLAEKAAK